MNTRRRHDFLRERGSTALLALAVALVFVCAQVRSQPAEFRALWVDGWGPDLWTPQAAAAAVDGARKANFNTLICQARRRADSLYRLSPLEPVCREIEAGFDPLANIISMAHDATGGNQRIDVHAWLVTYPAWGGTNSPPPGHPALLRADWLTKDASGYAMQSFDPGHPEVQRHIFNVVMNILTNYDVDGVNLDYIRYSSEGEGYNSVAVSRFNRQSGRSGSPSPQDPAWKQWRRNQVSALLRKIYLNAAALRPSVIISCDTVTWSPAPPSDLSWTNTRPFAEVLQDWRAWTEEGILDLNIPMLYFRHNNPAQAADCVAWQNFAFSRQYNRAAVAGLAGFLNSPADTIAQMRQTKSTSPSGRSGAGLSLFSFKKTNKDNVPSARFLDALPNASDYDPIAPPIFSGKSPVPVLPWKTAPATGHLKGFIFGGSTTNPLDGATIEITGPVSRHVTSDATAFYGSVDLPPGDYAIRALFDGFAPLQTNCPITAGAVATLDIVLPAFATNTPPAILAEPVSITVSDGERAEFLASASGSAPLRYQWLSEGVPIPGATLSALIIDNARATNSGNYALSVTNSFGAITGAAAALVVAGRPPGITLGPSSRTTIAGRDVTLECHARGSSPMTWRWLFNGAPIGSNSPTLVLSNIQPAQAGSYAVEVTNSLGFAAAGPALVSVFHSLETPANGPGRVIKDPARSEYPPGAVVTLRACSETNANFADWNGDASGLENPLTVVVSTNMTIVANFTSFQQETDIILDNNDPGVSFYGAWSTGTNAGKYGSDYRYAVGGVTGVSNVVYRPNIPADGRYDVFIWYNQGPNRATNAPWTVLWNGGAETIFVNQQTNGAQWLKIASARDFSAGAGGWVRLSSQVGVTNKVVMADAVRFVRVLPPFINAVPVDRAVIAGQDASFLVSASGTDPIQYQWRKDGIPMAGQTGASLQIGGAAPTDAGAYGIVVSNPFGTVNGGQARLTVNAPQITAVSFDAGGRQRLEMNWASSNTIIEATSDFTNWLELPVGAWATNAIDFSDPDTNALWRFYRTRWR